MIAVIVGPDDTLVRDAVREILRSRDPRDEATTRLDGRSVKPADVHTAAASAGFFGAGRVVLVEDLLARYAKGTAKNQPDWAAFFAGIPAENTLLLVDRTLASVPAAVKKALPKDAVMRTGGPPRGRDLLQWMIRVAKEEQAELGQREAQALAERLYPQSWGRAAANPMYDRPPDLGILRQEIARLALAAYPGPITSKVIVAETERGDEDRIFDFLSAALAGNLGEALAQLDRLLEAGEEPARLLAQLAGNVEVAAVVANAGGMPAEQIAADIGARNPRQVGAIGNTARELGAGGVRRAVTAMTSADRRIKRGELRDPADGLYETVISIAQARRTTRR